VRAPFFVSIREIDRFVNQNADFILDAIDKAVLTKKHFCEGEEILFKGKSHIIAHDKMANRTRVEGDKVILGLSLYTPKDSWLKFLKDETSSQIHEIIAEFGQFDTKGFKIIVKSYQSKWGSCSRNCLSFNLKLAMAPVEVIRYVVVHELCHIDIKNHSKHFYDEVEKFDPNYKTHRRWFKQNAKELSL